MNVLNHIPVFLLFAVVAASHPVNAQNPVVPGYFADPSVRYIDGKYYMSVTSDGYEGHNGEPVIWVSDNLVEWDVHPLGIGDRFFWAPSLVKGANGKYYMAHQNGVDYNAYIMEAPSPLGPWKRIAQVKDFDLELFVDPADDRIYGIGSWKKLLTFENDPASPCYMRKVLSAEPLSGELTDFTEGPYIFHRNNSYYLMWAGGRCWLDTYNIRYAMADTPSGMYYEPQKESLLATDPGCEVFGPGHNSVIEVDGRWFMFYHRQDKHRYPTCNYRFPAVAELFFDEDETIGRIELIDDLRRLNPKAKIRENRALGCLATANSEAGEFTALMATDGRNDTRWRAENGEDRTLTVDLGRVCEIERIVAEFEYPDRYYLYKLETSVDNKTWAPYADYTQSARHAYDTRISEGKARGRYVRLHVVRGEGGYVSLWELKVY